MDVIGYNDYRQGMCSLYIKKTGFKKPVSNRRCFFTALATRLSYVFKTRGFPSHFHKWFGFIYGK
jgi:hypothetical protein